HDANNSLKAISSIEPNLIIPNVVQSIFAQFAFFLLAILLPRSLEYQCRLMSQWKMKSQSTLDKLSLTSLALARLLISIVPRFVIAKISNPERPMEIYSKSHQNIGIILINFIIIPSKPPPPTQQQQQQKLTTNSSHNTNTSTTTTMKDSDNKSSKLLTNNEEPTEIADRIRLLNRVVQLVDSLAVGERQNTVAATTTIDVGGAYSLNKNSVNNDKIFSSLPMSSSSTTSTTCSPIESSKLNLVKIYTGGTMVGYAYGLGTLENSVSEN
ncbi:unnamed protein product, partial [Schistosoma turkestanicum]